MVVGKVHGVQRGDFFRMGDIMLCSTLIESIHGHSPLQIAIAREVQKAHSYMHPLLGYLSMKMRGRSRAGVGIVF